MPDCTEAINETGPEWGTFRTGFIIKASAVKRQSGYFSAEFTGMLSTRV